jgi:hypothetical protein
LPESQYYKERCVKHIALFLYKLIYGFIFNPKYKNMKKTFYLLLLSLGTLAACKKSDTVNAVGAVNSNQITYKVVADSAATYNVGYMDSTNNGTSISFTGKTWSKTFSMASNFKSAYLSIQPRSGVYTNGTISILVGSSVKGSTTFSDGNFAQLFYNIQ